MRFSIQKLGALAALLLLLSAAIVACGGGSGDANGGENGEETTGSASPKDKKGGKAENRDGEEDEEEEEEAVPVEVEAVRRGRIESVLRFSTNLEAENEVGVFSQASRPGRVRQLLVEEGDDVGRGRVLLRLEDDQQRTALDRVRGQLDKAKREYERQRSLFDQKLISEQAFNEATYDLEQLELALRDAERELSYTEVKAPISGTVTARMVSLGDQVTANQHLFDIVDFDSIVARVYVPEKELPRVAVGQEARILAQAAGGEERRGSVIRIAPRGDPKSGTVKVTVSVPRSAELLPGMYVSAELVTAVHEDALLLSKRALVHDGDQRFVFRVNDESRAERLLVRAALEDSDNIEPDGQLAEGDRIVVAGQAGLKEGSLVRLVGEGAPAAPEAPAGEET